MRWAMRAACMVKAETYTRILGMFGKKIQFGMAMVLYKHDAKIFA
jgi:hypothetical protein